MSENELTTAQATDLAEVEAKQFELAQRKAMIYAKSTLVPKAYQNNVGNVLIAQNMAQRLGADVLMVMQNLYIVHGNPAWSAKFNIACFNSCGKYTAIKYRMNEAKTECVAHCIELATGEVIEGVTVSLEMAKAEGWTKNPKYKSMPELMLRYRAATFLIRSTAPEITMGLHTVDEMNDVQTVQGSVVPKTTNLGDVMKAIAFDAGEPVAETLAESMESNDAEAKGGDLFPSEGQYE
jgi:hypothetical protein